MIVTANVANPTPLFPHISIATKEKIADRAMFTMLFATRSVLISLFLSCKRRHTRTAFLFFCFHKKRTLSLFKERNALNEEEKIIESKTRTQEIEIKIPKVKESVPSIILHLPDYPELFQVQKIFSSAEDSE